MAFFVARDAGAHEVGLSRGDYGATGDTVTVTLTFSRRDVAPEAGVALARELVVRGDGALCPTELVAASELETDGVMLVIRAVCRSTPTVVTIEAAFLAYLPFGHRHLARVSGGADQALTLSKNTFTFAPSERARPSRWTYVRLGFEHILTGFDHLVFLLGLVIIGGAARELLLVITAFTVGHSVSLALATFGVFVPSGRWVEPLIAASIVYVGVENLYAPSPRKRVRVTLPFGFVHGFGFAGALRELALPRAQLPGALALFNLGVELGQVAALAAIFPFVIVARRRAWFRERGVRAISVAIAVLGFAWFAARVL